MHSDIFSLHNKVIVITGGSGHLGSALSEAFVQYGGKVYLASRNTDKNKEYASYLASKYDREVCYQYLDTTEPESVEEAIDHILSIEGKIDVLVNNSYQGKTGTMLEVTEKNWMESFDGSIHSTFRLVQAVLPSMIEQQSGSIINIASMYGVVSPNPEIYGDEKQNNPPHYGAAKAAIIQFTKYIACHYGKDGIRANAISPGPFPTQEVQKNNQFIKELGRKNPLGRIGQPKELKGIALLLASDAGSYMTGQNISVDGGWTAW